MRSWNPRDSGWRHPSTAGADHRRHLAGTERGGPPHAGSRRARPRRDAPRRTSALVRQGDTRRQPRGPDAAIRPGGSRTLRRPPSSEPAPNRRARYLLCGEGKRELPRGRNCCSSSSGAESSGADSAALRRVNRRLPTLSRRARRSSGATGLAVDRGTLAPGRYATAAACLDTRERSPVRPV